MSVPERWLEALRDFLQRETGFLIPAGRWAFLAPRFLARLEGRGFTTIHDYLRYLKGDPRGRTELEELLVLLTVRKTSFFRNPASYLALTHEVLPRLARGRSPGTPVCLWSAGCSTGEEPYSLAMVARDVLSPLGHSSYVLATDIV
jgi:chemotaxis methyl-accepting protein methylase